MTPHRAHSHAVPAWPPWWGHVAKALAVGGVLLLGMAGMACVHRGRAQRGGVGRGGGWGGVGWIPATLPSHPYSVSEPPAFHSPLRGCLSSSTLVGLALPPLLPCTAAAREHTAGHLSTRGKNPHVEGTRKSRIFSFGTAAAFSKFSFYLYFMEIFMVRKHVSGV